MTADPAPVSVTRLAACPLGLRLTIGVFFLVWSVGKIMIPATGVGVAARFYGVDLTTEMAAAAGSVQTAIVLLFMAGAFRAWTTGALLVMRTISVLSTVGRLADPYTPPNALFWAAVPVVAALTTLLVLRAHDTLGTYRSLIGGIRR